MQLFGGVGEIFKALTGVYNAKGTGSQGWTEIPGVALQY